MNIRGILVWVSVLFLFSTCIRKIIPDKPVYSKSYFHLDSVPESEISIPVQINLKPFYLLAEKKVDSVFTSPNWPSDWVMIDCANRYKYYFRRSPLTIFTAGRSVNMGFTGYYKIIGSTRACIGNAVLSPWTPPCSCGFDDGERRVKINFTNSVTVFPDFKIRLNIKREEPEPLDKCTVCFFAADITNMVMKGLKEELDMSKKSIEDSFAIMDFKLQAQDIWNKLNASYNLQELGWLRINPQKIRLNNYFFKGDSLNLLLGLTAKPVIQFEKYTDLKLIVPDLENTEAKPGFNIFLDAVLSYDSLGKIINARLKGQSFEFEKSGIKRNVVIRDCMIYGSDNENLVIRIDFSGSHSGIAYFTGLPVYNEKEKMIEIKNLDFDVKTKNILLKNAEWLFNRRIVNEIARRSRFDLSAYLDTAMTTINARLNQEWIDGVKNTGHIRELKITGFFSLTQHLVIRSQATGNLEIKMNVPDSGL